MYFKLQKSVQPQQGYIHPIYGSPIISIIGYIYYVVFVDNFSRLT